MGKLGGSVVLLKIFDGFAHYVMALLISSQVVGDFKELRALGREEELLQLELYITLWEEEGRGRELSWEGYFQDKLKENSVERSLGRGGERKRGEIRGVGARGKRYYTSVPHHPIAVDLSLHPQANCCTVHISSHQLRSGWG